MNTQTRAERVYLVGASLAALGGAVSRRLNSISKAQVRSRGVVAARISGWAGSISTALPSELAVVLEAGGNGVPTPEEVIAADQRLRDKGFSNPIWLLWSAWTKGPVVEARRQTTTNILRTGVRALDVSVGSSLSHLAADKIHINAAGARLVTDALRTQSDWPEVYMSEGSPTRGSGAPLPPPVIHQAAMEAADRHGVPLALVLALTFYESGGWNPLAVSSANARGLGQLLRGTAREVGYPNFDDMFDPAKNLDATCRYLKRLNSRAPNGSWEWTLGAYRAGPGAWALHVAGRDEEIRHRSGNPRHTATLRQAVLAARSNYIPKITRMVRQYIEGDLA